MATRIFVALPLLILALLAATPAPPAGAQPPAPTDSGPVLAGRNCGGTLFVVPGAGLAAPAPAALPTGGWGAGTPVDAAPDAMRQIAPSMAITPAGRAVYAWQEVVEGDSGNILVANSAAALQADRRGVRVDDAAATVEQRAPTLAADTSGRLHSVWQDRRRARGSSYDLYYASSSDGGATWSANTLVYDPARSRTRPSAVEPSLLADPAGRVHLIWRAAGGSTGDIYYSRREGGAWMTPITVNDGPSTARRRPVLALASDGDLLAAWEDERDGASAIYYSRLDLSAGATAWDADSLATPAGVQGFKPSLAAGKDGTVYLAYQGSAGIFLTGQAGGSWSAPIRVDNNSGSATNPRLAVDSAGNLHCIWCRLAGSADILAALMPKGGSAFGAPTTLASTTGTAEPLALVADKVGNVYAA